MGIRQAIPTDYPRLVEFFKAQFPVHNIFQRSPQNIQSYLMNQGLKNPLYVVEKDGEITAALILFNKYSTSDRAHKVWKLRHFAFANEAAAEELLKYAEGKIKKSSKTAKIELSIAETEKSVEFYKDQGYLIEGVLKNHYRWNETTFIVSKSFS